MITTAEQILDWNKLAERLAENETGETQSSAPVRFAEARERFLGVIMRHYLGER